MYFNDKTNLNFMSIKSKEVVIVGAVRTPIGTYKGSLKHMRADQLGSIVIEEVLKRSQFSKDEIDEVIMGQVLAAGAGQNPARQAAINAGIPKEKPAYIVNQVCGSGIRSVVSGFQSIVSGDSKIIISGGQENMSLAPHAIHLRDGKKLGNSEVTDTMIKDGLWDAFNEYHMGMTAENVAEKFQVTREEQDKFAFKSQEKALKAQSNNRFKEEIVNFKIKSKKAEIDFFKDESLILAFGVDSIEDTWMRGFSFGGIDKDPWYKLLPNSQIRKGSSHIFFSDLEND